MKTFNCLSFLNLVILHFILFYVENTYSHALRRWPRSRQGYSYLANDTACTVDDIVYREGDSIPTGDPCEVCRCRPPGFHCVVRDCPVKPGCKAIRREGECCHEYQCGCEYNGKYFNDGDTIPFEESRCYACICQGSSITCALLKCEFRMDCEPEYIAGECCPRYDHCRQDANSSQVETVEQFDNTFDNESIMLITSTTGSNPVISSTIGHLQTTTSSPKPSHGSTSIANFSLDNRPPSQTFNLSDTTILIDDNSSQSVPTTIKVIDNKTSEQSTFNATEEPRELGKNFKQQITNSSIGLDKSPESLSNETIEHQQLNPLSITIEEKLTTRSTLDSSSSIVMPQSVQIEYVSANQQNKSNINIEILLNNLTNSYQKDRNESSLFSDSSDQSRIITQSQMSSSTTPAPMFNSTFLDSNANGTENLNLTTPTILIRNQTTSNETNLAENPPILLDRVSTSMTTVNTKV